MRELLVIAYLFPPLDGVGVQRTLGFVRHLPANGWRPTVICADVGNASEPRDSGLLQRVPHDATVIRVRGGWPSQLAQWAQRAIPTDYRPAFGRWGLLPDRHAPWGARALRVALRVAQGGRFSAVCSTGRPGTNHLVAAAVGARTGLPWVADASDPRAVADPSRTPFAQLGSMHRTLENAVYRNADRLVVDTPGHMRTVQSTFAGMFDKVTFIPNGFAESDFLKPRRPRVPREPLLLGWADPKLAGQTPNALVRFLVDSRPHSPRFRLRCMSASDLPRLAAQAGVGDLVEDLGALSHPDMLDRLGECHATVVSLPPSSVATGLIPQSLYLYFRLGRPLIALLPPGDAADLVREAGDQHLLQAPDRIDGPAVGRWLHRLANDDVAGVAPDLLVVRRHARDVLTQRLAGLLTDLVTEPRTYRS